MPARVLSHKQLCEMCREHWTKLNDADKAAVKVVEDALANGTAPPLANEHAFHEACLKARA